MNQSTTRNASCFCGAVEMKLTGQPEVMAYCHCNSCRHWSAGQVSAFTLWQPEAVEITRGSENIATFSQNPRSDHEGVVSRRKWCTQCGGHLYTEHPTMGLIDFPAVLIEGLEFEPAFHVHYQEQVQRIPDGLPKYRDLPEQAGGSGALLPE